MTKDHANYLFIFDSLQLYHYYYKHVPNQFWCQFHGVDNSPMLSILAFIASCLAVLAILLYPSLCKIQFTNQGRQICVNNQKLDCLVIHNDELIYYFFWDARSGEPVFLTLVCTVADTILVTQGQMKRKLPTNKTDGPPNKQSNTESSGGELLVLRS